MRVRSRISGRERELDGSPMLPSVYEQVGGVEARVVPGGIDHDSPAEFLGGWPDPLDLLAIERVVAPLEATRAWNAWVGTLPLVPKLGDAARLQPLDRIILRHLAHLQHVCQKPRLHLRVEEERLPISRARRVPERATSVLVSHPEDWEHRTLRSVRPSRVLARQTEDEWDLYENRVAARLVDHLLRYAGRRVEELRRIQQMYEEGSDFAEDTRGSLWRGGRLFELWGAYFTDNALARELEETLSRMTRMQRDLQALLDSPLYQEIPRRTFVALSLQTTNILVNDPHYRKIAELWREWARLGHVPQPGREDLRKARHAECASFDAFSRLVVIRALSGLGYTPARAPESAAKLRLEGPLGGVQLSVRKDGVMLLSTIGGQLQVTPILSGLAGDDLPGVWRELAREADHPTLILLLGRRDGLSLEDPVLDLAFAGWLEPRVQLISPWSIDSVERIGRVLGSWISANAGVEYPPAATVRPDPGVVLPAWLRREGDRVLVVAPATADEVAVFQSACDHHRGKLTAAKKLAEQKHERSDPGKLNSLPALRSLAALAPSLEPMAACPVCHTDALSSFEPRVAPGAPRTWWCRCPGCKSEWGTRACAVCKQPFPVLMPAMKERHPGGDEPAVDWVDRYYGRDLWAEPCWRPGPADRFRCGKCGVCPGGGCARCASAQ
jgi:hypothetical protein